MNTNRKYKDSVFTTLFGEKDNLLELYNAVRNTNYGKDTPIEITTLEDALFMEQMNDISFLIDGKIVVLIEHQSTINPNMPLRMLLYMARIYEKITESDDLYSRNKMAIAYPDFIVLYNGKDEYPDRQTLKLSEMFARYGKEYPISLELLVEVYNINKGRNSEMTKKSKTLDGYEEFIAEIREYEKTMHRDEAIEQAVKDCISRGILSSYLKSKGSEVVNMLLKEWNMEDALRVREREGRQQGIQQGIQEGIQEGIQQGMQQGIQEIIAFLKSGRSLEEAEKKYTFN